MVDDMVDTAGTLAKSAAALKNSGAVRVLAVTSHGVLAGPAIERLNDSPIEELIITNSVPLNGKDKLTKKIRVLSIASLLGDAIRRIHEDRSISELFKK